MTKKGKLIVIEGTDCSGKETQTKKLVENLQKNGYKVFCYSFPNYDSPTGKIVGGPFLGKETICEGWFKEKAPQVDPLVASAYYAADRRYNKEIIEEHLNNNEIVIIDRYVESNMAHQGGKIHNKEKRLELYKKLETLEYEIMELPYPDHVIFLYMPYEYGDVLRKARIKTEKLDQNEASKEHLCDAEKTYLELAEIYNFLKIDCVQNNQIRSIENIADEVYERVRILVKEK